jgi:hypothetical protein
MSEDLRWLTEEELAEEDKRPWRERHPFVPPTRRDGLTLEVTLAYERCYEASGNPVFVFMAHQARTLLRLSLTPEECALRFGWVDEYFNRVARRMTDLAGEPPSARDAAIAEALGFGPRKRGGSSEFSDAKRSMRDIKLGVAVDLILPVNNGKEAETFAQVGSFTGRSGSSIGRAHRRYKRLVRGN